VTVAVLLGVVTEFGQLFVPHRGANVFDLMANMLGVTIAAAALSSARYRPR